MIAFIAGAVFGACFGLLAAALCCASGSDPYRVPEEAP